MSELRRRSSIAITLVIALLAMAMTACGSQTALSPADPSADATITPPAVGSPAASSARKLTLQASIAPPTVARGESLTVRTDSGGSKIPRYTLSVDGVEVAVTRWDGTLVKEKISGVVNVLSWTASADFATWELQALVTGDHTVTIHVSGEVAAVANGASQFNSGSQTFHFMVTEAN